MRKKMLGLTAAAVCLAMLAGCGAGGGETAQPYTKEQAQKILDSGIFTYTLDEYDYSMAWDIYGLESAGLSQDQLVDGSLWNSSGADCEQLALLIFSDADGAEAAVGRWRPTSRTRSTATGTTARQRSPSWRTPSSSRPGRACCWWCPPTPRP